jgi:hypothetical protein
MNREHSQAAVTGWSDQAIEGNRIDAQLIATANGVSVLRNNRQMLGEQHLATAQAPGEDHPGRLHVPPSAQVSHERSPLRFKNAQFHDALNRA